MISPCPAAASSSASASRPGRPAALGGRARRRGARRLGARRQQRAQGRQADRVEGPQRHLVLRQRAQRRRHAGQRLLPQLLDRARHGVAAVAGMEHAVDRQALVVQPQRRAARPRCAPPRRWRPCRAASPGSRSCAPDRSRPSSAALKRTSCIFRPECGPRHDAPRSLPSRKPVQALGRLSRRRVWPVGAVSKTMWSQASAPSASRDENSSKEAISVVQAPDSCSRTVDSSSVARARAHLRQHALAVGLGRGVGVDVEHRQAGRTRAPARACCATRCPASRRGSTPHRC